MSRPAKTLEKVLRGTSDANIGFDDLRGLLRHLGFDERVKGDHHIFTREGIAEILNLQPRKGGQAKPYQVRQVRDVIVANELAGETSWQEIRVESRRRTTRLRRRAGMSSDHRYEIILYWSNADGAFIAEVPELSGCAADGATYQEALAAVEVVIAEWVETAKELGRPIPEPRGRLMFA